MRNVTAHELLPNDWQRLRDIRLASLVESPEAFGADYELLSKFGEQQWREIFARLSYLVANLDGKILQ